MGKLVAITEPVFAVACCGDRWSILAPGVHELSGRGGIRRVQVLDAPRVPLLRRYRGSGSRLRNSIEPPF
jgi:hypothetical protein